MYKLKIEFIYKLNLSSWIRLLLSSSHIHKCRRNESAKRREDTISLEAREITKFFDLSTGSPNNSENLDRESWIYRRDQLAMSEEDYSKLFKVIFTLSCLIWYWILLRNTNRPAQITLSHSFYIRTSVHTSVVR